LQRIASERLLKIYMNTSHIFYLDVQSVPGTEEKSEEPGLTREELKEQERLRKEAIMIADRERRMKYKKQEEQRESVRQNLRDKVWSLLVMFAVKILHFRLFFLDF